MDFPNYKSKILATSTQENRILITRLEVLVDDLPLAFDNFKIVALTDFHYGCYTNPKIIEQSLDIANKISPDLIFLLGDYVHSGRQEIKLTLLKYLGLRRSGYLKYRRSAFKSGKLLGELLKSLKPKHGIFSVWGNHDYLESCWMLERLLPPNIKHLKNETKLIEIERDGIRSRLGIFGLDDVREGQPDISPMNTSDFDGSDLKILLSHNPDFVTLPNSELARSVNLILSGHTHGGQICLPGGTPLKTETEQNNYRSGFYRFGESPFYISNGIGCSGLPLRLFCPPEVVEIVFRTGAAYPS